MVSKRTFRPSRDLCSGSMLNFGGVSRARLSPERMLACAWGWVGSWVELGALVISPTNARGGRPWDCVLVLFYLGMANLARESSEMLWEWNHCLFVSVGKKHIFCYSHHCSVEISSLLKYVVWTREFVREEAVFNGQVAPGSNHATYI